MKTAQELAAADRAAQEAKAQEQSARRQHRECVLEAAAARARKLAGKIDDPVLLLACLRFYASIPAGEWVSAESAHELTRGKTRKIKNHYTAARRILHVMQRDNQMQRDHHPQMRLPLNWRARLAVVGLNGTLLMDQSHGGPADLIARTRAFLRGELPRQERTVKRDRRSVGYAGVRSTHATLHEAMANKSDDAQDDYAPEDDRDSEPEEPDPSAFSRTKWLQERISAFLRDRGL